MVVCDDVGDIVAVSVAMCRWPGQRHQWVGSRAATGRRRRISIHSSRLLCTTSYSFTFWFSMLH